jgi:hypothetical protein
MPEPPLLDATMTMIKDRANQLTEAFERAPPEIGLIMLGMTANDLFNRYDDITERLKYFELWVETIRLGIDP